MFLDKINPLLKKEATGRHPPAPIPVVEGDSNQNCNLMPMSGDEQNQWSMKKAPRTAGTDRRAQESTMLASCSYSIL